MVQAVVYACQAMRATKLPSSKTDWHCVTLKEERRIEEAPSAYKPIGAVIEAQEQAGLNKNQVDTKAALTEMLNNIKN